MLTGLTDRFEFLDPAAEFPLPEDFDFDTYIDIERELWALFPETDGKRTNFVQVGLTALIYAEAEGVPNPVSVSETYFLMPCADKTLRPIRMRVVRRLTLGEYRMAHLTAVKLLGRIMAATDAVYEVGVQILGTEVLEEVEARLREDTDPE